jgi:hypothetical protein
VLFRLSVEGDVEMKNLEKMIWRQVVFALVPLSDMPSRAGQLTPTMPTPISLAGIK